MDQIGGSVWRDEQWSLIHKAVLDEAQRARAAAQFLPTYGPVDPAAVAVPSLALDYENDPLRPNGERLRVNANPNLFLTTIAVQVWPSSGERINSTRPNGQTWASRPPE